MDIRCYTASPKSSATREDNNIYNRIKGVEFMEVIILLVVAAFLVESLWETLKMVWQEGKLNIDRVGALLIGLIIAFVTKIDILAAVGLETSHPIVGILATGILISRGGNYIHDLMEKLDSAD